METAVAVANVEMAERTVAWLQSLDPLTAHRQALLAGGVPRSTVHALYPLDLTALVPGLVAHLRAVKPELPATTNRAMIGHALRVHTALQTMTAATKAARRAYWAPESTQPGGLLLGIEFMRYLPAELRHRADVANGCAENLWYAWYFMQDVASLNPVQQQVICDLAAWYGEHLFKLTAPQAAATMGHAPAVTAGK